RAVALSAARTVILTSSTSDSTQTCVGPTCLNARNADGKVRRRADLLPFKTLSVELQRPAVLGDCSDDLVGGALREVSCDLKPNGYIRAGLAHKVRDH